MKDPFAIDTDDTKDEKDTVAKTETAESQNTPETSVTLKGGSGYDAPWVVVRTGTPAEALALLNDDETVKALVDKASKVGAYFAAQGGSSNGGGSAKPARQEAPNGESKTCRHGTMVYRSGVSKKTGKPYKMFACPSDDRDDECDPVFVR